jgi:hypothetical protein
LATYGIDYYGDAYYGASTLTAFSAGTFVAKPYYYQQIQLTWSTPSGAWDYIRLVRNPYGFAVNADDGDLLFEDANGASRVYYLDQGQTPNNVNLTPARPYYYSLFVRETQYSSWQKAGDAIGISVKDYGTAKAMFQYLPEILGSEIPYDTSLESTNTFLERFLTLFAFQLDLYKSQAENITNRYDVTNLNGLLIPAFMQEFGLKFEPALGIKQSKIFLRNISRLFLIKGTLLGLKDFIKSYAGYDNLVSSGKNLMLDHNDSSFEQNIGTWSSLSNATLARHLVTDSPTVTPYHEPQSQTQFPNLQGATLQVTSTATATTIIGQTGDNAIHYGIPVTSGSSYTFTAYTQAGSTGRNVSAQILWYDNQGAALTPSSYGTATTSNTSTWTRVTSSVTAPSGAAFAVPNLNITSTAANEKHYFDALQFEAGSYATYFQDARQIEITLIANRINEVTNPNFEGSTTGWSVTNGTIATSNNEVDPDEANPSVIVSGGSAEIYASAAGLVTLASAHLPIFSGNDYTFSVYCFSEDSSHAVTPYVSWYDSTGTLLSTTTGTALTADSTWVRPFVTAVAPSTAASAVVGITFTGASSASEVSVDAALMEKSAFVNSYFDGSNGVAELSDLFWEGTANLSRSHYYRNRFAVQSRLIAKLPDWITSGSTFELFFAQSGT